MPYQKTAEAALINVAGDVEGDSVADAIRSTGEQTSEDCADLERDQAMTEQALRQLDSPSSSAVLLACADRVARRHPDVVGEQLSWNADDYEEGQTPYSADVESLKRFLEAEVLPWYEKRRQELEDRPLIRAQAFG